MPERGAYGRPDLSPISENRDRGVRGASRSVVARPLLCLSAPAVLAQSFEPKALGADIPAQPLAHALTAFGRQTGLQLVYVSGVVRNQRSTRFLRDSALVRR